MPWATISWATPIALRIAVGAGRAVGDDADAVDAEQHGAAVRVRIEGGVERQQRRHERVGVLAVGRVGEGGQQCADQGLHPALERLQRDVAGEPVGDGHVEGVGHQVAPLDVADEADPRRLLQQGERLLAQRVALAGLLTDRQQADAGLVDVEALARVHRPHLGELHEPLGLDLGVGAGVDQHGRRRAGHGDRGGDGRALDALDPAHPQQRRGHRGAGVAGRHHRRRPPVAHRFGGRTSVESFLVRTAAPGSSPIAITSLAGISSMSGSWARLGWADEDDREAVVDGAPTPARISPGARSRRWRHRDRQHRRRGRWVRRLRRRRGCGTSRR